VDQIKLLNFADFFLIAQDEDLNELRADLIEAGLPAEANQDHILDLLKQKRAELLIQTGRKFKENYLKLKNENTLRNSEIEFEVNEAALAYRNKSDNSDKVEDAESVKMDLIKKAKEKSKE
jgi:hypothetical protein